MQGCSTGGRQGLMMAQRYPEQYDGILAAAPAINWSQLLVSMFLPPRTMMSLGKSSLPRPLEDNG
jgi:feruloyl esterase